TGEVLVEAGDEITERAAARIQAVEGVESVEVLANPIPASTTPEILRLFGEEEELENPQRDQLYGRRPVEDVVDPKTGKVITRAYQKFNQETSRRTEGMGLPSITLLRANHYIEATVDAEGNIQDME